MSNELLFTVEGPFDVPLAKGGKGRFIEYKCPTFWENCDKLASQRGCYVFAIRAGRGFRPVYVGKTKRTFREECFAPHKIAQHYTPAIHDSKGSPVMFFLIAERKQGGPNARAISDLEEYLIDMASKKNPELSNIQKKNERKWAIKGLIGGGHAKTSTAATKFKKAIGIK